MSGGILQLVAYGAQDLFLTGQPQITFFKTVYRRHTMFSMESIQQTFSGSTKLGGRATSTISRNGDLLSKVWITAKMTVKRAILYNNHATDTTKLLKIQSGTSFVKNAGYGLIKKVEVEIGGQVIDRQYSDWLQIWSELTTPAEKQDAKNRMTGLTNVITNEPLNVDIVIREKLQSNVFTDGVGAGTKSNLITTGQTLLSEVQTEIIDKVPDNVIDLYIPLQFWFCRNEGLALPLIALQYHEVKLNVEFATLSEISYTDNTTTFSEYFGSTVSVEGDLILNDPVNIGVIVNTNINHVSTPPTGEPISNVQLWADYIYLDVDERKRFAQVSHEYLIDQLQHTGSSSLPANATRHSDSLTFNHPVKELVWVFKTSTNQDKVGMWLSETSAPVSGVELKLNGHDRFATRPGKYFSMVQPFQHHTRVPTPGSGVYVYSFALKPEEHQPSGTCNFSRIDNAQLIVQGTFPNSACVCKVFAVNYNILRVISGMAGIAYSS